MDYTHTISTSSADLGQALAAAPFSPCFIVGYVSPHLDLDKITKIVQRSFPQAKLLLCSTAGELCNSSDAQLYCDTPDGWDNIVLQFLSAQMVERVEVISVPLECADLKSGTSSLDMADRIMRLQKSIETASRRVLMPIDYRDTLAYIVFDGLSASESFFMEALYATNKFPCLFIGGSAGGKLDFQNTWVHDGQSMLQGHATIAFLKLPPDIRFGVFKSQNFEETGPRFRVKSGSTELRFVQDVKTHNNETMPLIEALCQHFSCDEGALDSKMGDYSFAAKIGDDLLVRSIAQFDFENKKTHFYCDISPGEDITLVKRTPIYEQTQKDFKAFLANKPSRPISGWLNDCILRRLCNSDDLSKMPAIFKDIPVIGFSTFGEILGLNLNQTLTSIFFFKVENIEKFHDHYIDDFILHYSNFQAFFQIRRLQRMNGIVEDLVDNISSDAANQKRVVEGAMNIVSAISQKIEDVVSSADDIKGSAENLQDVVGIISTIASQTNLLSLNATIEAARAGDHGRGFAVVANEVRALATKSKENAGQVSDNLKVFSDSVSIISGYIEQQVSLMQDLGHCFDDIQKSAEESRKTADMARDVSKNLRSMQ